MIVIPNPYVIPGLNYNKKTLSIKRIKTVILQVMDCKEEVFTAKYQKRHSVYARYFFCYFTKKFIPKITQEDIGQLINRDRTIVPHAITQIKAWVETNDPLITPWFNQINEQLKTNQ